MEPRRSGRRPDLHESRPLGIGSYSFSAETRSLESVRLGQKLQILGKMVVVKAVLEVLMGERCECVCVLGGGEVMAEREREWEGGGRGEGIEAV